MEGSCGRYFCLQKLIGNMANNEKNEVNSVEEIDKDVLVISKEAIRERTYIVRNQKVMFDFDLAEIYGYETKNLNRQVKNKIKKFLGEDFMFELTDEEVEELSRCKNFTLKDEENGRGELYNQYKDVLDVYMQDMENPRRNLIKEYDSFVVTFDDKEKSSICSSVSLVTKAFIDELNKYGTEPFEQFEDQLVKAINKLVK